MSKQSQVGQTFGQWLSAQMAACGFTTNMSLERKTGIDNTTISRWRSDLMTPGMDQLRKLEEPLRTPLLQLLIRAGYVSPEEAKVRRSADQPAGPQPDPPGLSVVPPIVEQPLTDVEEDNEVLAAIRRDADLDDSAKAHFLNQYELLRELSVRKRLALDAGETELLPYVAHGRREEPVDPAEEQRIQAEGLEAVRRNPDSPARDK